MSIISSVHPIHFGLEVGAMPVRKIKPRTGRLSMPGHFPTRKGTLPSLRTESLLELEGLGQFEVNHECLLLAAQPHHLVFEQLQPDGGTVRRVYTPDLAILLNDKSIVVIDFKPAAFARSHAWREKEAFLAFTYERDHGVIFRTITNEMTGIEPRRTNVSIMLMHRPVVRDDDAMVTLASVIASVSLPSTIGEITRLAGLKSEQPEIDRAFSGLMEMAITGEIALDLGLPLSANTVVCGGSRLAPRSGHGK